VDNYIYAVAGRDYHEDLREVERYDPKSNTWEYVTPLKKEVRSASATRTDTVPQFLISSFWMLFSRVAFILLILTWEAVAFVFEINIPIKNNNSV